MTDYGIKPGDVAQVYFSTHCFGHSFKEHFDYMGSPTIIHPTAGLDLMEKDGQVFITTISPGMPITKIPRWCTRLKGSCLLQINGTPVSTITNAHQTLSTLPASMHGQCTLLMSSSEIRDGLTYEGIPRLTLDQLSPRYFSHNNLLMTTFPTPPLLVWFINGSSQLGW